MKVEVAVPNKSTVSVDVKQHFQLLVFKPPVFVSNSILGFSSVFRAHVLL